MVLQALDLDHLSWYTSSYPVEYLDGLLQMEAYHKEVIEGTSSGVVWFLEHLPVYTSGSSAKSSHLLQAGSIPVVNTGRGGQYTYHGPGQRVVYVMLPLARLFAPNKPDIRSFVYLLERAIIDAIAEFGIQGERREGRVGIWVKGAHFKGGEAKIAALGLRVSRGITMHGLAVNISPNLDHFGGIIPCGISNYDVTSMQQLGIDISMQEFDIVMKKALCNALRVN